MGLHRCVEMLIKEQMRKYKVKMEEISQLEAAESIAFRRLSLLRQNTVSARCGLGPVPGGAGGRLGRSGPESGAWVTGLGCQGRVLPPVPGTTPATGSLVRGQFLLHPDDRCPLCLMPTASLRAVGNLSPARWCFLLQPRSWLTWTLPMGDRSRRSSPEWGLRGT